MIVTSVKKLGKVPQLFLVITALGAFAMSARSVTDPDVWWHLRTGQLILQNHAVFHTDPYSFTRFGQPWINHEWLADALIYGIYSLGSWSALIITFAVIASAAGVLTFLRCRATPAVSCLLTTIGMAAALPSLGTRPQAFSLLLASVFLWILDQSEETPKLTFWLIPLMALWVNLHAGYAIGIGLIALYLFGIALDASFGITPLDHSTRARNLSVSLLGCLAVVPLNPYGAKMYSYPLTTLGSRAMQTLIQEWASPNFHAQNQMATLALILAIFVTLAATEVRPRPSQIVLLVAAIAGALLSVRHIPIFFIVVVPILSQSVQGWLGTIRSNADLVHVSPDLRKKSFHVVVIAALLAFAAARIVTLTQRQKSNEDSTFPAAATSFLLKQNFQGAMLNYYNWGGYLIWKLFPQQKVFVDGRADLYGDAFLYQAIASYSLEKRWGDPLEGWNTQLVLVPANSALVQGLIELHWTQVYADQQAVILKRTN